MRLATFSHGDDVMRAGIVTEEGVHPFEPACSGLDVVRGGLARALELGAFAATHIRSVPLSNVTLHAPLQPVSIRDFVAFEEHVEGVRRSIEGASGVPEQWYAAPAFYFSNPHAVIGPDDDVLIPSGCMRLDFELEVAAVIGTDGHDLDARSGHDAIFGYTVLNDWSARDLQGPEMQVGLGPAKGKDFATTLGPWIVTADALADVHDDEGFLRLRLAAEVNGVEIGRDVLANMGWPFGELVSYASRNTWVRAGDVLGSGTCGNGGCLAELWGRHGELNPPPLQDGDVVTLDVEGIGRVTNKVAAGPRLPPVPAARRRPRIRG